MAPDSGRFSSFVPDRTNGCALYTYRACILTQSGNGIRALVFYGQEGAV
jgi:hypothetical protein